CGRDGGDPLRTARTRRWLWFRPPRTGLEVPLQDQSTRLLALSGETMIRTLVRSAFIGVVIAVSAAGQASAQAPKLGVINSQALLAQAPGTPAAMAAFEQSMQGYQEEIVRLQTELQAMQDSLDQQGATLTAAVRQQRADAIQEKYIAFQMRQQELTQMAEDREGELVGPIIQQIETVVDQVRSEG